MIKFKFDNVKNSNNATGNYWEIQLLPQIGFIKWYRTKKDNRKIWGVYFVWIFWNILFYVEKGLVENG